MSIQASDYEVMYNSQYLYDANHLIVGVVQKHSHGWSYRSCVRARKFPAWSDFQGPVCKQEDAIEQCIAHYISRLLE